MRSKSVLFLGLFLLVACGCDSDSSSSSAPPASGDTVPPSDVTGFTATSQVGAIDLSWNAATDNVAVASYKVTVVAPLSLASSPSNSVIVDSSTLGITWTGLSDGVDYTFEIVAFDTSDNASVNPARVTQRTLVPDTTPPLDPTNLVGTGGWNDPVTQNFVEISLSWAPSASSDVSHYLVCIRTVGAGTCDILNNYNVGNVTSVTIPGAIVPASALGAPLQIGTDYSIRVIAVDTAGNQSTPGASTLVTPTQSTDTTPPASVRNLAATPDNGSVILDWDEPLPIGDAASYAVYFRTPPASETVAWTPFSSVTSTTETVTGLLNGTAYEFMVAAIDASGNEQVGAATAATPDDDAAKISAIPSSGAITSTPNIQGGVFREAFFTTRPVVVLVATASAGILAADANTQFHYTLDGSQIDPADTSNTPTHGFFDFLSANVVEVTPGFLYAVTVDFDPSVAGVQNVSGNLLRPDGTADHIELNYQIIAANDASPKFTEHYLIYPNANDSFVKFSGMREDRDFTTATLVTAGNTAGDVIFIGGEDGAALASAERYRERFEHFEALRVIGLSATMGAARYNHRATLLQNGETILVTGGFNLSGQLAPADGVTNESLGLRSFEVFQADATNEGFGAGGTMSFARRFQTSTRLFDGRVLIVGGLNGSQNLHGSVLSPALSVARPSGAEPTRTNVSVDTTGASLDVVGAVIEILSGASGIVLESGVITASEPDTLDPNVQNLTVDGLLSRVFPGTPFRIINAAFDTIVEDSLAAETFTSAGAPAGTLASLPTLPRYGHTATLLHDGTVFIAGGVFDYDEDEDATVDTVDQLSCEVFSPDSNTFIDLNEVANLSTTRFHHRATLLRDGKVLITGGVDRGDYSFRSNGFVGATIRQSAEIYDPFSRTTRSVGNMTTPRFHHTATLLPSGKVLICGGYIDVTSNGILIFDASAEIYDPDTETFTATSDMLTPRGACAAALVDLDGSPIEGRVLVGGGSTNTLAELYNESLNRFEATAHGVSHDRFVGSVTTDLMDGTVLLTGGQTNDLFDGGNLSAGDFLEEAEVYDSSTVRFTPLENGMVHPRRHHTATLLRDGTVLVAGGENDTGGLRAVEIYDPSAETFTEIPAMIHERYKHTATLLADGRVLLCGGASLIGPLQSCEIYDPLTQSFTSAPSMSVGRFDHTATLLPNGHVLIAGGESIDDTSVEIFDPVAEAFLGLGLTLTVGRNGHAATNPAYTLGRARFTNGSTIVEGSPAGNSFGYADTLWTTAGVTPGDLIISESQNVPYVIDSITSDNQLVLADIADFTHDDTGYSGTSTTENLTQSQSTDGYEHYVILSQNIYFAGGEVATTATEVFDFDAAPIQWPPLDPADATDLTFNVGQVLNAGRFGHALTALADMTLVLMGGRNRPDGEFTTDAATPGTFADDPWNLSTMDLGGASWDFPNAFRVRNGMVIVLNEHSAQAFLHE